MAETDDEKLDIGHVLFIDIVGYSKLLIEGQKEQFRRLTEMVLATAEVQEATNEQLVRLPTGDGMALVFRHNSEAPARCALQVAQSLKQHPELEVRMGIHSGPVSEVTDLNGRINIAGAGINIAQRVMDCGDAGHILLSQRVADELEHYARWKPYIHPLGTCAVKHRIRVEVANFYTSEIGNPNSPGKLRIARRRRLLRRALAILLLAIGAGVAALLLNKTPQPTPSRVITLPKGIAVLPFENLSADKENAYFSAGIRDEILTRLANLRELKVIARTSTERYQSRPLNTGQVAEELGVSHFLEGSVQKLGQEVHVNVQLIEASSGAHIWAKSYDRTLENAFAVEGEVAQAVANELKIALVPAQLDKLRRPPTQNPAAYDLYLKGDYALEQARKNPGDYQNAFEPAISSLQQATVADPEFALAFARLAYAQITKEEFGHMDGRTERRPELLASAKQNIDRAIQLQPDLPESHLALGRWHYLAKDDRDAALKEYGRALELQPDLSEARARIASLLNKQGRTQEAIELYIKGLESDPRNYQLLRNLGIAYTMRREYQRAAEVDSRIVAMDPADELDSCNLSLDILQSHGDLTAARKVLDNLISHLPAGKPKGSRLTGMELMLLTLKRDFLAAKHYAEKIPAENWETDWSRPLALGDIESHLGNKVKAQENFESARLLLETATQKDPEEPQSHSDLGGVYARLGRGDEAVRNAQRAIELEPVEKYPRDGALWLLNLAQVYGFLGRSDEAMAIIERLLAMPNTGDAISAWQLKLDPIWDSLRNEPRFQRIVAPLSPKGESRG